MPKPKQASPRELYHQRKVREERERAAFLPPGLINHGNTCFMNSVLQGLMATRLMRDLVTFAPVPVGLQGRLPILLDSARSPQLTNGHGVAGSREHPWIDSMPIGDQFLYLMYRAWDYQSDRRRESLSPKPLLGALGRKYQQYLDFTQQDAHEFLRILFDAMRMEEVDVIKKRQPQAAKKPKKRKSTPNAKRKRPSSSASRSDAPPDTLIPFTDMLFAGQLTSILVCQKCKNISRTYEDFYDISLSIKPEDYATSSTSSPSTAGINLFSLKRSATGVKEKSKESESDGHEHGAGRKRDKFRKFAKRITTFQSPTISDDTGKPGVVELDIPRSSSVPPGKGEEGQLAEVKSRIRRQRSRSLDHPNRGAGLEMGTIKVVERSQEREGLEDGHGSGEGGTGRDEANSAAGLGTIEMIESDWSVVRNGEVEPEEVAPLLSEGKNKQKTKDREEDGWVKLGKKLSLLATRHHRDKEPRSKEGAVEEFRAKMSRESSPDTAGVLLSGRSTPRREHSETPPPVPPKKIRPVSTPPTMSPPALHYLPPSLPPFSHSMWSHHEPAVKFTSLSPLSQPPYQASSVETAHSGTSSTQSGTSSSHAFHLNWDKSGLTHSHETRSTQKYRSHTPTPAEVDYLRRILADIDLSKSESSATPSSGWPPGSSSPALVNPFALLMKSSAAKKGADGSETVGKSDAAVTEASPDEPPSHTRSHKWSSWLGINRVSGLEECLRLFMSVEVLDNENMVGCRRCWKIANRGNEREVQNGDEGEEDEDESSSEEEGENPLQPPSSSSALGQMFTRQPEKPEATNTPGGMPIPTISTTGPESPLEPPPRPRVPQPLRSNSADFVSLSVISSRERTDAPGFARNASSPSIPSTIVSPQITPYPSYSFPPFALSSQYQSPTIHYSQPPTQMNGRDSLVIPQVPMTRRRAAGEVTDGESDESTSVVDSRSGEDGDDRASIGSSSSFSVSRSGDSSEPRSLSDSGYGKVEDERSQRLNGLVNGTSSNGEVGETIKGESKNAVKRPKKPKPVIMRPAYKRYLIATAPPVLVVHLKRFQQTEKAPLLSFTPTYGFKKLDDYVTFPEYLDLTPFLAPRKEESELNQTEEGSTGGDAHGPGKRRVHSEKHEKCMYRLYAIIVHLGNMLGGHYIAYTAIPEQGAVPGFSAGAALSPASAGETEAKFGSASPSMTAVASSSIATPKSSKSARPERQWAYVSDTSVRLATLEEVLKAKAYICMYERI